MQKLRQRFNDWRLEQRIKTLGQSLCEANKAGDSEGARLAWRQMMEAIGQRSIEQQSRMTKRVEKRITQGW